MSVKLSSVFAFIGSASGELLGSSAVTVCRVGDLPVGESTTGAFCMVSSETRSFLVWPVALPTTKKQKVGEALFSVVKRNFFVWQVALPANEREREKWLLAVVKNKIQRWNQENLEKKNFTTKIQRKIKKRSVFFPQTKKEKKK